MELRSLNLGNIPVNEVAMEMMQRVSRFDSVNVDVTGTALLKTPQNLLNFLDCTKVLIMSRKSDAVGIVFFLFFFFVYRFSVIVKQCLFASSFSGHQGVHRSQLAPEIENFWIFVWFFRCPLCKSHTLLHKTKLLQDPDLAFRYLEPISVPQKSKSVPHPKNVLPSFHRIFFLVKDAFSTTSKWVFSLRSEMTPLHHLKLIMSFMTYSWLDGR